MMIDRRTTPPLQLVAAIGRRLDGAVCAGSIANAARSVQQDAVRAGQRREAMAAIEERQRLDAALRAASQLLGVRRTG
jgi:hypothetical protein